MNSSDEQRKQRLQAFELQQKLLASPEMGRIRELNRLTDSVSIFAKNYGELRALLNLICVRPEGMEFFSVDNHSMWEQAMHELSRLMHNFVAAGVSIVDHAKALHGRLHRRSSEFSDFQLELDKRVFESPVAAFMRELRNHFMHIGTPGVGTRLHYSSEKPDFERQVTIPKSVLRPNDWKLTEAKVFLNGIKTDYVDVGKVVEEYRFVVEDFFAWMYGRLRTLHRSDFDVVAAYQKDIFKLRANEIEDDIQQRFSVLQRGIGTIIDVLTPFMTVVDSSDLSADVKDLRRWTEEALARIESVVPLSTELKTKLLAMV